MKNAFGFLLAGALFFSFGPRNDEAEKISYKKLRDDRDGTYRKTMLDNMRATPGAYFPLLSDDMADLNLVRFVTVDFDVTPVSAEIKTTLPDYQKNMRLVEHFTDHNENGLFEPHERDELEFHFVDGAFRTDDRMHRLDFAVLYEDGKPDLIDRDEIVEYDGDSREIRESYMSRLPERYRDLRNTVADIMKDPVGAMAARRKTEFHF